MSDPAIRAALDAAARAVFGNTIFAVRETWETIAPDLRQACQNDAAAAVAAFLRAMYSADPEVMFAVDLYGEDGISRTSIGPYCHDLDDLAAAVEAEASDG